MDNSEGWIGYNTYESVRGLLQQETDWGTDTIPTLSHVIELNSQIYSDIRLALRIEVIDVDNITNTDELRKLALLNAMGTVGLIEKVQFNNVPQLSGFSDKNQANKDSWTAKYEKGLENFLKLKRIEKDNYGNFGVSDVDSIYSSRFGCSRSMKYKRAKFRVEKEW
jgi:hypothetical protein